ncbi:MAG TPA: SEC-C metal-binding domain-containing protein [Casimicrobiaceae bacterium]
MTEARVAAPPARNAPCPCGSGKRYKACHGTPRGSAAQWVDRALREMQAREFSAAEASLREAQRLAPNDPRIDANLGTVYVRQHRFADAEAPLSRALALAPDLSYALTLLAHARQWRCAWNGLSELHARIAHLLDDDDDGPADFNPFALLAMPTTPAQQRVAARRFARGLAPRSPVRRAEISFAPGERLRVGFASSDFRSHATVTLMVELWERLDRRRLELFAYGTLARDPGPVGRRVERAFEHYADVSTEPVERAAARIRADRIGILLDLNGYTRNARPAIFAQRPAPLQVNAIGFQCTLGTTWHDYILTDRYSLPEPLQRFYTERPLYMPHMAFPSDTTRLPPGPPPPRAACGLPDEAFVFCCFNNTYKILPEVFAIWMRLLAAVPKSVLWLLETGAEARENLRVEAAAAGIDPLRLVFAPIVPVGAHVARNAAADLFLDTYPYGAHTTANDALLAGLPLMTCVGETLASRIAGSQLQAIGLPELITPSLAEYEALARTLATEPELLEGYRQRLAANRRSAPLFDMDRYARDFEEAMERIWDDHAGRSPA